MMPNFSVVIPMYNVANYIERCLLSVFRQNISPTEYEIILVNDGSPDNSEEVARAFCEGRANVKIITQINKGLGGARNTGITNARGEYLIFLDSDDVLLDNFFNKVKNKVQNEDIIEFGYSRISGMKTKVYNVENSGTLKGTEYILNCESINSACNKIYNREFILKNNLSFKEKIYGEDIEFNIRAFLVAEKVKSINLEVFGFYLSNNSITRNKSDLKKAKYLDDLTNTIVLSSKLHSCKSADCRKYLLYRLTELNVDTLLFIFKNKLPKDHVIKNIQHLEHQGAFLLSSKLKKREIYRQLLNSKFIRNILISMILK